MNELDEFLDTDEARGRMNYVETDAEGNVRRTSVPIQEAEEAERAMKDGASKRDVMARFVDESGTGYLPVTSRMREFHEKATAAGHRVAPVVTMVAKDDVMLDGSVLWKKGEERDVEAWSRDAEDDERTSARAKEQRGLMAKLVAQGFVPKATLEPDKTAMWNAFKDLGAEAWTDPTGEKGTGEYILDSLASGVATSAAKILGGAEKAIVGGVADVASLALRPFDGEKADRIQDVKRTNAGIVDLATDFVVQGTAFDDMTKGVEGAKEALDTMGGVAEGVGGIVGMGAATKAIGAGVKATRAAQAIGQTAQEAGQIASKTALMLQMGAGGYENKRAELEQRAMEEGRTLTMEEQMRATAEGGKEALKSLLFGKLTGIGQKPMSQTNLAALEFGGMNAGDVVVDAFLDQTILRDGEAWNEAAKKMAWGFLEGGATSYLLSIGRAAGAASERIAKYREARDMERRQMVPETVRRAWTAWEVALKEAQGKIDERNAQILADALRVKYPTDPSTGVPGVVGIGTNGTVQMEDGSVVRPPVPERTNERGEIVEPGRPGEMVTADGVVLDEKGGMKTVVPGKVGPLAGGGYGVSVEVGVDPRTGLQKAPKETVRNAVVLLEEISDGSAKGEAVPVEKIAEEMPSLKSANAGGVGEGSRGKPVIVLEEENGNLVLVTGRGRLAEARETGAETIQAIKLRATDGWTRDTARMVDVIDNVRNGTLAEEKTLVAAYSALGLGRAEAEALGMLRTPAQRGAFTTVEKGGKTLIEAAANGVIGAEKAGAVAEALEAGRTGMDPSTMDRVEGELVTRVAGKAQRTVEQVAEALAEEITKRGGKAPEGPELAKMVRAAIDEGERRAREERAERNGTTPEEEAKIESTPVETENGEIRTLEEVARKDESGKEPGKSTERTWEVKVERGLQPTERPGEFRSAELPEVKATATEIESPDGKAKEGVLLEGLTPEIVNGKKRTVLKILEEIIGSGKRVTTGNEATDRALAEIWDEAQGEREFARRTESEVEPLAASAQRMADGVFGKGAVKVRAGTVEEMKAALQEKDGNGGKLLRDGTGAAYGFWDPNAKEVVLFPGASTRTVAHEVAWHAVREWAKENRPELARKMDAWAAEAPEDVRQWVEENYKGAKADELLDEFGAHRLEGERLKAFERILEKSPEAKKWYERLWEMVRECWRGMTGRNDVAKMSPDEAVDWLVRQIEEGRQLKAEKGRRTPDAGSYKKLSRKGEKEKSQETSELSHSRGMDPGRAGGLTHGQAVGAVLKSLETGGIVANAPKEVKGLLNNLVDVVKGLQSGQPVMGMGKPVTEANFLNVLFKAGIKQHSQTVNGKTIQGTKKSGHASGYRVIDDRTVRVSTHSADAEYFLQNGTGNNMSFVIRRPSIVKELTPHPKADVLEIVYNRATLKNNPEDMARIVHDIAWFIGTGEFCDTVGATKYNYSGSKDFIREKMLGLIEDAGKRGDEKARRSIEKDAKRKKIDLKTKIADAALSIGPRSNEPLPISAGEASAAGEIRLGDIADLKIPTRQSVAQGGEAVKGAERIQDQTQTRQFRNWFGKSKIVDGEGKPLVVYRGAPFDPLAQEPGKGVIMPEAYFTADPEYAKRYTGAGGAVRAYYLKIERPFDIRNPEDAKRLAEFYPPGYKFARGKSGALDWAEMANFEVDDLRQKYPEYDGIILDEGGDPGANGKTKYRGISFVPLEGGAQVKSATDNAGTFDPQNPDVRLSRAEGEERLPGRKGTEAILIGGRRRVTRAGAGTEAGENGQRTAEYAERSDAGLTAGAELETTRWRDPHSPSATRYKGMALSTSELVKLYRDIQGTPGMPRVMMAESGKPWLGRVVRRNGKVQLDREMFGLVDESDRVAEKNNLKAAGGRGSFRHEDPTWALAHSTREIEAERNVSEMRLEGRLEGLAERRVDGTETGGGRAERAVLAHEIGHLVCMMPDIRPAGTAKSMQTLGKLIIQKLEQAELTRVRRNRAIPGLNAEAVDFKRHALQAVKWWRGFEGEGNEGGHGTPGTRRFEEYFAKNDKELYAEVFGMFLAAPRALEQRAPDVYAAIRDSIAHNDTMIRAFNDLRAVRRGEGEHERVMREIEAQWTIEAQRDVDRLERDLDRPVHGRIGDWKLHVGLNMGSAEAPAVMVTSWQVKEKIAEAKRNWKRGLISKNDYEAIRKDLLDELAEMKLAVLVKQRGGGQDRVYALDFLNKVIEQSTEEGVSVNDLRRYLQAQRVIEVQGRAMMAGIDARQARRILDDMKARLGNEGWIRVEAAAKRFQALREKNVLDNEWVREAFGDDLVNYWRSNAHYVTTRRTMSQEEAMRYRMAREQWARLHPGETDVLGDIEALMQIHRSGSGASHGTTFLKPLQGSFRMNEDPLKATLENDLRIMMFARRNHFALTLADAAAKLRIPGFEEHADRGGVKWSIEGGRYGTVGFMRDGERRVLVMPKAVAEGFKYAPSEVNGLIKLNRMLSAVLTQYSPRFALRNIFRNRATNEINIPWMQEGRVVTAARLAGVGKMARLGEFILERAMVRLPDRAARNALMNVLYGEKTNMYWVAEASRIAKMMYDPHGIREMAKRADQLAAEGKYGEAQRLLDDLARAKELMKHPIFAGTWQIMKGTTDRTDLDAVFRGLDLETNVDGTTLRGLGKVKSWLKRKADTVRRFNSFEECRIKVIALLAAERAKMRAQAKGREFFSGKEVDYLTATMSGSPRYENRGRWMNVLEATFLGPFANVGMKGAQRTLESMRIDPGAWWRKASGRILGRIASTTLWTAGGYALVAAIARRIFSDDEEAQRKIDAFEDWGKRQSQALANVSDYRLRNYDIVPVGMFGRYCTFGISLPRGDEDRMLMPFVDMATKAMLGTDTAKKLGLGDPIDATYSWQEAFMNATVNSGLMPDIMRGSMFWNVGKDTLYAWMVGSPYNTFTQRTTYEQKMWDARWEDPVPALKAMGKQLYNDLGGGVVMPASTWDEDEGGVPEEGTWVMPVADGEKIPVKGSTIFQALHYVPFASSMLSGVFFVATDGDKRIQRRIDKLSKEEKALRDQVAMRCLDRIMEIGAEANVDDILAEAKEKYQLDDVDWAIVNKALVGKVRKLAKETGNENEPILKIPSKVNEKTYRRLRRYLTNVGYEEEDE